VLFEGTGKLVGAVLAGYKVEKLSNGWMQRSFERISAGIADGTGWKSLYEIGIVQ
jgi:hypothetical protein